MALNPSYSLPNPMQLFEPGGQYLAGLGSPGLGIGKTEDQVARALLNALLPQLIQSIAFQQQMQPSLQRQLTSEMNTSTMGAQDRFRNQAMGNAAAFSQGQKAQGMGDNQPFDFTSQAMMDANAMLRDWMTNRSGNMANAFRMGQNPNLGMVPGIASFWQPDPKKQSGFNIGGLIGSLAGGGAFNSLFS